MEKASRERAAQNGGVDPQTQPAPQAQGDAEAKRKSTRTVRREWEKAKGKKWPKDKDGKILTRITRGRWRMVGAITLPEIFSLERTQIT